jgi:rubrerythrin
LPSHSPRAAGVDVRDAVEHQHRRQRQASRASKTEENLKDAFAGESQANRRYLYFANKADVEGQNDVAALFRSTAEGETGHAHGHLEYLEQVGDPATGLPIGAPSRT